MKNSKTEINNDGLSNIFAAGSNKVEDSSFPRPFTVNSWIEDNPPKLNGLENEMNVSRR